MWQRSTVHELRPSVPQDLQEAEEGQVVQEALPTGLLLPTWHGVAPQEVHTPGRVPFLRRRVPPTRTQQTKTAAASVKLPSP